MATTVFLHIGLPKTGTTYLQEVLWTQWERLRAAGLLMPGMGHREHLWAALESQGRDVARRHKRAPGAWSRLLEEIRGWSGGAIISHEFFCGASAEQAAQVLADLQPARVHLIVTARHALGMLTAGWQESVKNGGVRTLSELAHALPEDIPPEFSWQTWDLGDVLERWAAHLPSEQVHILPMPGAGSPPDQHWRNFAGVLGIDPADYPAPPEPTNTSLGVAQIELLRRVNTRLDGFRTAVDRGVWIRGYLAERQLATQGGDRPGPGEAEVADCRARAERAVALIRHRGYRVSGEVGSLLVPADLPPSRAVDAVTDAELVDAATALVAGMLADVRMLKREVVNLGSPTDPLAGPGAAIRKGGPA